MVVAGETAALRESEEKQKALYAESQQREKVLVRRLAAKEQEMQDYVVCFIYFISLPCNLLLLQVLYVVKLN